MRWSRNSTAKVTGGKGEAQSSQTVETDHAEIETPAFADEESNSESHPFQSVAVPASSAVSALADGGATSSLSSSAGKEFSAEQQSATDENNQILSCPAHSSTSSTGTKRTRADRDARERPMKEYGAADEGAGAAAVLIDGNFDGDSDEEGSGGYDAYDFDPGSGSDHALPDPPIPPADEEFVDDISNDEEQEDDEEDQGGLSPPFAPLSRGNSPVITSLPEDQATNVPWRPQKLSSTCEFTHKITNYSQKRESGCKKAEYSSTTVDAFGNRWRLIVYVNGNGRASNHHLSLFLQVADADDLPFGWKKAVSYVLTLEHPSGNSLGYAKRNPDKTFKLCPKAIDWGWSQFITSDRIQQEGYIRNDSLTVRASVTVKSSSVSIDSADAELYLKCAVEEGNSDAVQACLAQGASVNCQFKDDLYTPLHTACSSSTSNGSLKVLTLLLDKGADGNACNKWRETPLLIAANNGNKAAVEALLDHGADPSLCSEAGWSALTFAAHKGYEDIVILLLTAGAPVNCRVTEDLSTPLHKACAGGKPGHLSAVKQLLGAGGDVHALNKWRETPLLTAANHGQAASVEALLQSGADPCKCTDTGWSPLSIAAYKGHDDVVRILLEEGAPTEEADPTLSALLQAATKGLPDTVDLLLRHGADHTVTTKKGDTALSILVEQNLIDAAVEMVTEYKASVPRCSRDRKKVQRASLLINLQLKKQQREGNVSGGLGVDSEDSENDESTDSPCAPLHDNDNVPRSKGGKKKKGKNAGGPNAEQIAAAAEAALLEELEQEEVQKDKEQAASSKKAAKKKKKKEKERQVKVKEEKERMERERIELQVKERLRMQKMKEEKAKREREKQEREAFEQAERERELARDKVRKAKEEANRRQRELEKKERERKEKLERKSRAPKATATPRGSNNVSPNNVGTNHALPTRLGSKKQEVKPKTGKPGNVAAASPTKRRGWETKPDSAKNTPAQVAVQHPNPSPFAGRKPDGDDTNHDKIGLTFEHNVSPSQTTRLQPREIHNGRLMDPQDPHVLSDSTGHTAENASGTITDEQQNIFSVDAHIESMATGMVESFLDTDSPSPAPKSAPLTSRMGFASPQKSSMQSTVGPTASFMPAVVHPYIASYRQDRLESLLHACHQISAVGKDELGAIFYRWTLRASHGSSPSLDKVIPSWTVANELVNFFQRQLISESRRSLDHGAILNIEFLRETGATIADLCLEAAKEVVQCREKIEEQMFGEWADSSIGMNRTSLFDGNGNGENMLSIDWQGRSSVQVSAHVFACLERRYCGPPQRILAAMFNVAKRYETQRMLASGNFLEKRLSPTTMDCLRKELNAGFQGFSDPLTAPANSLFCGIFQDVDIVFGGLGPLGSDGSGSSLFENGCSLALVTPSENIVASRYCHFLVDMLEQMDRMLPLSFCVVFPFESFHDLKGPPKYSDLPSLDARLGGRQGVYVKTVEELPSGKHCFVHGDLNNSPAPSRTGSLLVLLQNEGGSRRYPTNDLTVLSILGSMRPTYDTGNSFQPTLSGGSLDFQMRQGASAVTGVRSQLNENSTFASHIGTPVQASRGFVGRDAMPPNTPTSPFNSNTFASYGGGVISGAANSRRVRLFDLVDDDEGDENDHSVDVVSGMLSNLGVNMFENTSGQDIDIDIEAISLLGLGNKGSSGTGNNNGNGDRNNHNRGPVGPDPFSN